MSSESLVKVFDSRDRDSFTRYLLNAVAEIKIYRFALSNFVINNLRMRYRRSVLGFVWSLLNPLLVMMVISVVFSLIFKQEIRTFSLYIFSGLAPWGYISSSILGGCQALINGEGFMKKVYVPKLLFPLIFVSTETVNFLFSIVSLYILALLFGATLSWKIIFLPLIILIIFIFNFGWAILFSVITVYFRDFSQIMAVVFQALFYVIPIVYPLETIPIEYRFIFNLNPFYYFVMLSRKVIYGQPELYAIDFLIPTVLAVSSLLLGLFVLMKQDRDIIYRL